MRQSGASEFAFGAFDSFFVRNPGTRSGAIRGKVATAVYAAGDNVNACGSGNDYANDPVPQTTIPDPLPICT